MLLKKKKPKTGLPLVPMYFQPENDVSVFVICTSSEVDLLFLRKFILTFLPPYMM